MANRALPGVALTVARVLVDAQILDFKRLGEGRVIDTVSSRPLSAHREVEQNVGIGRVFSAVARPFVFALHQFLAVQITR